MAKIITDENKIKKILTRGVEDVIVKEHLEAQLKSGKELRIKFGIDPTTPDIHLGPSIPFRKLKQFQDLGHKIILIIGDFTAMIGDPSGRSETRKQLTKKEIKNNLKNYLSQAGKIINIKKTEIHYNSKWFSKNADSILELSRIGSIQQVLHRADFQKRISEGKDITLLEVFYPLFQGYDSFKIKSDIEIGGTDQRFNLLMGRQIQKHYNMPEQDIITLPLIEGTDGIRKMSKSYGNYIGINEQPNNMFGKIMSIPDNLIIKYFLLCADLPEIDIEAIGNNMKSGKLNPRDAKLNLAFEIVSIYHGEKKAQKAKDEFIRVFSKKELPKKIDELKIQKGRIGIVDLLLKCGAVKSKGEAKRLIEQKGVKLNNEVIGSWGAEITLDGGEILQIGKRKFIRIG